MTELSWQLPFRDILWNIRSSFSRREYAFIWYKLIESGKRPLDSAENIIKYMSLAKEFWNQKHTFIEKQLKYEQ